MEEDEDFIVCYVLKFGKKTNTSLLVLSSFLVIVLWTTITK